MPWSHSGSVTGQGSDTERLLYALKWLGTAHTWPYGRHFAFAFYDSTRDKLVLAGSRWRKTFVCRESREGSFSSQYDHVINHPFSG